MVSQRGEFQKKLQDKGVPTAVHYPRIMPDQPWYKEHAGYCSGEMTHSRKAADHVVSLPLYPDMDEKTQNYVIETVIAAIK